MLSKLITPKNASERIVWQDARGAFYLFGFFGLFLAGFWQGVNIPST